MGRVGKRLRQPTSHSSSLGLAGDDDEDFEFSRDLPAARALPAADSTSGPREVPDAVAVPAFPFDGDGFGRVELQLMGVADGIGHSVAHGVTETGHQIADISKSVWHGIFG